MLSLGCKANQFPKKALIMFEFGKKITFRPWIISILIAFLPTVIAGDLFKNWAIAFGIGGIFFLYTFFAYYFPNVPLEFQYWQVDQKTIKYTDIDDHKNRLLGMLCPPAVHFTTIQKSDIIKISLVGNINKKFTSPMAIPYTPAFGVTYAAIAMVHNPDYVRLELKNGQIVDLSIRRDYTYSRDKTLAKLDQLFVSLDNTGIQIDLPKLTNNSTGEDSHEQGILQNS